MKQAHSWLRNCFINAAIGKKWPLENRNRGRVKYIYFIIYLMCHFYYALSLKIDAFCSLTYTGEVLIT